MAGNKQLQTSGRIQEGALTSIHIQRRYPWRHSLTYLRSLQVGDRDYHSSVFAILRRRYSEDDIYMAKPDTMEK